MPQSETGFDFTPPEAPPPPDAVPDLEIDIIKLAGLYDKQCQFAFNDALFCTFLAGVGAGKSHAAMWKAVMRMLRNPGVQGAVLGRTGNDLATVLLPHLFGHLQTLQDATGVNWIRDYNKGAGRLELINGGACWFRPYNRIAKLRGLELAWGIADETEWAEADPDEIWTVLSGRLRAKCPWPGLDFVTSPNGLRGITKRFHDMQIAYHAASARGDAEAMRRAARYKVVRATSFDNPYLPDYYHDSLRSMSTKRYREEVLGIVQRARQSVFDIGSRHVIDWNWREHPHLAKVLAVDWGSGAEGHHFAAMAQVDNNGRWIWCDETTLDGAPRGHWRRHLAQWIKQHGNPPALAAADRAIPLENNWLRGTFPMMLVQVMESRAEQKVENGTELVRDMLDPFEGEPRMLFARSLEKDAPGSNETAGLLHAMRNLRYKVDKDGQPTRSIKKDNVNDHAADACRMAVVASRNDPALHGGRPLAVVGLGPIGDEDPRDLHPKSTRRRW